MLLNILLNLAELLYSRIMLEKTPIQILISILRGRTYAALLTTVRLVPEIWIIGIIVKDKVALDDVMTSGLLTSLTRDGPILL